MRSLVFSPVPGCCSGPLGWKDGQRAGWEPDDARPRCDPRAKRDRTPYSGAGDAWQSSMPWSATTARPKSRSPSRWDGQKKLGLVAVWPWSRSSPTWRRRSASGLPGHPREALLELPAGNEAEARMHPTAMSRPPPSSTACSNLLGARIGPLGTRRHPCPAGVAAVVAAERPGPGPAALSVGQPRGATPGRSPRQPGPSRDRPHHQGRAGSTSCDRSVLTPGFARLADDARRVAGLTDDLIAEFSVHERVPTQ